MKNIKKKITFIYTDKVEYQCAEPLAYEAKKRGYEIEYSDNIFHKCEIGFYFQHICFPKCSKFSVVMLHDLGQQHGFWPNMWQNEFWHNFDLGLLPNKEWVDMWYNASCYNFVRPKLGCYYVGWQKADKIKQNIFENECQKIIENYKIDITKKTILYAPSWEWDNRQIEMIEACKGLNINLIIKHAPWNPQTYPEQVKIINEMKERSEGIENVYILDPTISIFNVINISDALISEESSTLYEAMMLDKPVIAVSDWLIPDTTPPRLPDFPYDFAIHINKSEIRSTIEKLLNDNDYKERIISYRKENYPNIGNASKQVFDILDSIIERKKTPIKKIDVLPLIKIPKKYKKSIKERKKLLRKKYIKENLIRNSIILSFLYKIFKIIKNKVYKK